jgi:tetratricopeptide (TPR) repeat protein
VEDEALAAWPQGEAAERIRLAKLHRLREKELAQQAIERDYGKLIRAYLEQEEEVRSFTPESPFLKRLGEEKRSLEAQVSDLYPRARTILQEGVFETPFLERFLSNWPEAPEVPRVALLLGDAHARLGEPSDAVRYYLRTVESAGGDEEAARATRGLKVLASQLDDLSALQRLALQGYDEELAGLAETRLGSKVVGFDDVDNGAGYLDRFPDGPHAAAVAERMNLLADKLYAEVLLYQAIGDHVKAVERINKILTYAPLSPAADLLRERIVLEA